MYYKMSKNIFINNSMFEMLLLSLLSLIIRIIDEAFNVVISFSTWFTTSQPRSQLLNLGHNFNFPIPYRQSSASPSTRGAELKL